MFRASSSRPAAIVNLLICLLVLFERIRAALPPGAEDEIVLIEHLPGRRVHLQDFFWTGVEDAPPWLDPDQLLSLYETRTIHHTATVYVPEDPRKHGEESEKPFTEPRQPVDCASCIDPTPTLFEDPDQNVGVLIGEDPGPRYWLLTVLQAGEEVPSKVELRLARLYKAAFTRQQQRHLGLLGPEIRARNSPKRQALMDNQTSIEDTTADSTFTGDSTEAPSGVTQRTKIGSGVSLLHMRAVRIAKSKRTLPILESEEFEELALNPIISPDEIDDRIGSNSNNTGNGNSGDEKANLKSLDIGLVQVRMQNMSKIENGATKLIYTVHLGGKPVPAETAAKDMALLSAQEVALELGAPVIIQSEPYLKESRPLALSRKRDAVLLGSAVGAGVIIVVLVIVFLLVKRSRAKAVSSAPSNRMILAKDEEYAPTTPGIDNTAYTSETEGRTEPTSGHRRTLSRTPGSQDTLEADMRGDISSENELENGEHRRQAKVWGSGECGGAEIAKRTQGTSITKRPQHRPPTIDQRPRSFDSVDSAGALVDDHHHHNHHHHHHHHHREASASAKANEEGGDEDEAGGSPHSYLSMPSCKQFPNLRSVEPLSKVLEPTVVKHLDLELDSPEMKTKDYDSTRKNDDSYFSRGASETKDPGVLGPIVWDLKRRRAVEGGISASQGQPQTQGQGDMGFGRPFGPVGRARRRLNELLEDSFSLFGNSKQHQQQQQRELSCERRQSSDYQSQVQDGLARGYENRGKSAHVSHVAVSTLDDQSRPRTSFNRNDTDEIIIPETGNLGPQPRGAWGSRPLSAGPFHRPSLPEVEVVRVLADSQLRPEDPAVPLIAAIKKELGKFSYE